MCVCVVCVCEGLRGHVGIITTMRYVLLAEPPSLSHSVSVSFGGTRTRKPSFYGVADRGSNAGLYDSVESLDEVEQAMRLRRSSSRAKSLDVLDSFTTEKPLADPNYVNENWHSLPQEQLFSQLESDLMGLSAAEAHQRLIEYGPNCITPPKVPKPSNQTKQTKQTK